MITPSKAESGVCEAPPWQNQSADLPTRSAPAHGLRDLIPALNWVFPAPSAGSQQPDIPCGTAPVPVGGQGAQGSVPSSPFPHQGRRILPQHTQNWCFPAASRLGELLLQTWTCLVMDHHVHSGQRAPFYQPTRSRGMEGAGWALARAGQVQELLKGSLSALRWDLCQRPATSREAFVEPGMGSSTPCLNSKASI